MLRSVPLLLAACAPCFSAWAEYPILPAHELRFPVQGFQWAMTRPVVDAHFAFLAAGENGLVAYKGRRFEGGDWKEKWESRTTSDLGMIRGARGIAKSSSRYIAVGEGTGEASTEAQPPRFATSTDGSTWTTSSSTEPGIPYSLAYGGGTWVMTGTRYLGAGTGTSHTDRFQGQVQYSTDDGATWHAAALEGGVTLYRAHWNGSLWVAVGEMRESSTGTAHVESRIYASPDGMTWTKAACNGMATLRSVTHGHGLWVAVGESYTAQSVANAVIFTSRDGVAWNDVSPKSDNQAGQFHDIDTTEQGFLAVGSHRILHSYDGSAWTPVYASADHVYKAVRSEPFGNGEGSVVYLLADTGRAYIDTLEESRRSTGAARFRSESGWKLQPGFLRVPASATGIVRLVVSTLDGRETARFEARPDAKGTLALPRTNGSSIVRAKAESGAEFAGVATGR